MRRRYSKELTVESGTPLGIAPRSDYSRVIIRDSVGRVISQDMKTVGNDIRRSEGRVHRHYIVKATANTKVQKEGKRAATTSGKVSDAKRKSEAGNISFDRYAQLYWATKG